jgi:hypothetical protein
MAFPRPLRTLTVGVMLMLAVGAFRPAEAACPTPPLLSIVYSPADGENNVPTNAVIDIHVFGDSIPSNIASQFSLWLNPSTPVNLSQRTRVDSNVPYITAVRLIPCQLCLFAQSTYQVRQGTSATGPVLATFTTGNMQDFTVPSPLIGATASVNAFDAHPDGGSDCVTERIRQVRLGVPIPDVGKPVVYTMREGGQVISADDSSLVGSFYCTGQPHWQGDLSWVVSPGQHTIQLSAVDRAGNTSASVDVSFNAICDGGSPDGGSSGGGGTGTGGGGGPVQATSCSCGTGVSAAIGLGGLAMILRARKRRYAADSEPRPR